MRRTLITAILILLTAPYGNIAFAADKYSFDQVHTQILFSANHLGFSNYHGEFHDYDGYFTFDPRDWSSSSVKVSIRAASIDMDNKKWEARLRSRDFFFIEKYLKINFKSTRVEQLDEKQGLIHGELTLLGVTRPVTLETTFNRIGKHPMKDQQIAGFSAKTVINRSDFGMKYSLPMVGDQVHIRLEVEGIRQ
ncbi:MAG: polyisoprenoid-binding protein [Gammaproteobacteria bacterium]|nr:polyisoprenoid-binding protein [Gammaproteobacteria bacterium]